MERATPQAFGYETFDDLWADYTVFTVVRNPYDRAGSAYDYLLNRRQVCFIETRMMHVDGDERQIHVRDICTLHLAFPGPSLGMLTCAPGACAPAIERAMLRVILLAVQDQKGLCRSPSFEHFLARPYIVGLQDMLFDCQQEIHDFYHVEPQFECLVDASGKLVADWVVRCALILSLLCSEFGHRMARGRAVNAGEVLLVDLWPLWSWPATQVGPVL